MKKHFLVLTSIAMFSFIGCGSSADDTEEMISKTFTGTATLSQSTFIDTEINLNNTVDLTIKNTGNQTLTISSINSSNNAFVISPTTSTINSDSEKKFTVTFTPTEEKIYTTIISAVSNSTTALTVTASGKGIAKTNALKTTYNTNIKPIMTQSCATAGCHNSTSKSSGIDLSTFALVKAGFQSKGCLAEIESGRMPKNGSKLSQTTIDLIKKWISDGYLENN
jgi:hypothetical protein